MSITKGQRIFAVFNYIFLTLLALSCILPILHLLAVSLSSKVASDNNMVGLIPVGFNTDSYKYLIQGNTFFRSFGVSVYRAVLGTAINILLIVLLAYPLSKNKEDTQKRGRASSCPHGWAKTAPRNACGSLIFVPAAFTRRSADFWGRRTNGRFLSKIIV